MTKAVLYWQGPSTSTTAITPASATFAGSPIAGTNIGLSFDNCWSHATSQAYRADVTPFVSGNGSYAVDGLYAPGQGADVNGVSLLVFFDDGVSSNDRDVVMFDGNDSNIPNSYDADGWNIGLPGIDYDSGSANLQMHDLPVGAAPGGSHLVANPSVVSVLSPQFGTAKVYVTLSATLTSGDSPISGAQVDFTVGGAPACSATSDMSGYAACGATVEVMKSVLSQGFEARFNGSPTLGSSSDTGPLVVVGTTRLLK